MPDPRWMLNTYLALLSDTLLLPNSLLLEPSLESLDMLAHVPCNSSEPESGAAGRWRFLLAFGPVDIGVLWDSLQGQTCVPSQWSWLLLLLLFVGVACSETEHCA